jgi:hypothetical protein
MTITTFEPGRCYRMNWVTDAQAETIWRVVKRTAKTVTLHAQEYGFKSCRVRTNAAYNAEEVAPLGRCSMAPVVVAARTV